MNQHARPVMAASIGPVHFEIRHVGKPGKRVPVSRVEGSEGPLEPFKREATLHLPIVCYIEMIIVDEIKGLHRPIQGKRHQPEKKADQQRPMYTFFSLHS